MMVDSMHTAFILGRFPGLIEMDHPHLLVQMNLVADHGSFHVLSRKLLLSHDSHGRVVPTMVETVRDSLKRYTRI